MTKKILITGSAGFIGFHLSKRLLDSGYEVIGFDNLNSYYDIQLKQARLNQLNKLSIEKEFGDVIFSLINYSRFLNINPELSIQRTNKKFIERFKFMEKEAIKNNEELIDLNLNKMEEYWKLSKRKYN